jgi:hypothetical protein
MGDGATAPDIRVTMVIYLKFLPIIHPLFKERIKPELAFWQVSI